MLRDEILSKLDKKNGKNKSIEEQFYLIHHMFMKEYGWIPLKEFLELPMQTINNLLEQINADRKEQNKKNKQKGKGKR